MTWDEGAILDGIVHSLHAAERRLAGEQAGCGLDGLVESRLRSILCESWPPGITCRLEEPYPGNTNRRCDVVLRHAEHHADVSTASDYWMEIKRVAQFLPSGQNWYYEQILLRTVSADLFKLARDSVIFHGGLLLLLFVADRETGMHDLEAWRREAMAAGCPVGVPWIGDFVISNRIGNQHAVAALCPLRRL